MSISTAQFAWMDLRNQPKGLGLIDKSDSLLQTFTGPTHHT